MSISSIGNSYMMECLFRSMAAIKPEGTQFINKMREVLPLQTESYLAGLERKFGPISVKSVGKDQASLDRLGASTYGSGNVVIAPNILEQMAADPKKAAYYEEKIQWHFDSLPKLHADLAMMGHEVHSCGIVIHEDGTVTQYVSGDLKPEVRARIEAQIEKEEKGKAERRRASGELVEETAEVRRVYIDFRAEAAQRADAAEAMALREQLSAIMEEWQAGSNVRRLLLWSEALQSARKSMPQEQKSIWDILFENRAENHKEAMELSRKARAADLSNAAVGQAYEAFSTTSVEATDSAP